MVPVRGPHDHPRRVARPGDSCHPRLTVGTVRTTLAVEVTRREQRRESSRKGLAMTGRMGRLVGQADGDDPLAALRALVELRSEAERQEAVLVRRARNRGASWAAIAAVLSVTRQAVHKKHGGGWGR